MSTELVEVEEISADKAPAIYGHNTLSVFVNKAREAVSSEVPDLSTKKGRDRIASLAAQVSRSKTAVEKPGREYLKRIKELPKTIEVELREFVTQMDALRDEVRAPLNEWEAAEKARTQSHELAIQQIKQTDTAGLSAAEIKTKLGALQALVVDSGFEEYEAEAHRAKASSLQLLNDALAAQEKYEAEQAELAELRRKQAEQEQRERDERIAREAAERAQREAEQRAQAERDAAAQRERDLQLQAERAERERLEAQRRAEQAEIDAHRKAEAAAQSERQRIADELAEQERQTKAREANVEHRKQINNAALAAFVAGGMTEECAKQAITLIAKGQIPNIQITY